MKHYSSGQKLLHCNDMKRSSLLWLLLPAAALFFLLSLPDMAMTQDLGRHLKMGEIITTCHCVPRTNLFSFTAPNFPFIDHHWFSEVVFYWLDKIGGLSLLTVFKIITITLSFGISFYLAYRKAGMKVASILGVFFVFILSERFYTRPELISFLCLSLFLWMIDEFKSQKNIWYLFVLPFVELLWVNSHIYFPVGVGLLFLLLIEQFIQKSDQWKGVGIIFFASLAVTLINPYGIAGAIYPLHIFDNYGYTIVENQSVFFLNTVFFNPHILVFETVATLFVIGVFIRIKKLDFFWTAASMLAMISAFMMIRNFSLFVLVAFPYTAQLLWEFFKGKNISFRRIGSTVGAIAAVFIVGFVMYQRFSLPGQWFSYTPGAEQAAAFFQKAGLKGPIFNNFDIGSYLIYRLYPQEHVFVDGRPEAYSVSFFDTYKKMQEDPAYFKQMARKFDLNTIVFAYTDITPWAQAFLGSIIHDPGWVPVYLDNTMIMLVKNIPKNQQIINKYKITLPH